MTTGGRGGNSWIEANGGIGGGCGLFHLASVDPSDPVRPLAGRAFLGITSGGDREDEPLDVIA